MKLIAIFENFRAQQILIAVNPDDDAAKKKARKEKAESIAKAGEFSLGKLLAIEEGGGYPIPIYGKDAVVGMGGAESERAPSVEPGSQEIVVDVTLRYEIKQ